MFVHKGLKYTSSLQYKKLEQIWKFAFTKSEKKKLGSILFLRHTGMEEQTIKNDIYNHKDKTRFTM